MRFPRTNPTPRGRNRLVILLLTGILLASTLVSTGQAAGRVGPALARRASAEPDARAAVWVFFTDRAGAERRPEAYDEARAHASPRALERRARRGTLSAFEPGDLPVHPAYVDALRDRGARLRGVSRWLNAASVEVTTSQALELAKLPFVAEVELVPRGHRIRPVGAFEPVVEREMKTGVNPGAGPTSVQAPGDTAYYGATFKQLEMMQVPALHAAGLSGAGVLVCMLDAGFRTLHEIFTGLNVLAQRDFVHGDLVVDDEPGVDDNGEASHGTQTLACVAGSKPGTYSGVAYGAQVALGRTEDVSNGGVPTETPAEMDYWQFGAEWADSLGADVISSSLGYFTFDAPYTSYTYADMDGRTTVVTLAAAEAARRGITVVTAAGNEGATAWHFLIAPGDADTVITVGAVDSMNVVTSFSSRGPSADGRTKPDVTAMGRSVYLPSFSNPIGYGRASGTSFATPLAAGVAALLLEAHPTWGPFEVREAMRETALNHLAANNDIGWGLIQGVPASQWVPSTTDSPRTGAGNVRLRVQPNPFHAGSAAVIVFGATQPVRIGIFDVQGRRVASLYEGRPDPSRPVVTWRGVDDQGHRMPAGVYWVRLESAGFSESRAAVLLP